MTLSEERLYLRQLKLELKLSKLSGHIKEIENNNIEKILKSNLKGKIHYTTQKMMVPTRSKRH
jgi:hypothetical protein